jgi:hypothetical protein
VLDLCVVLIDVVAVVTVGVLQAEIEGAPNKANTMSTMPTTHPATHTRALVGPRGSSDATGLLRCRICDTTSRIRPMM